MKKRKMPALLCAVFLVTGCSSGNNAGETVSDPQSTIIPDRLEQNLVEDNPYMAQGESIIHNDVYSSDVTEQILPVGIYPEITSASETEADKAVPCLFYDSSENCITPYSLVTDQGTISGGIAIRDVDADPVETLGSFLPVRDDGGERYGIQISYAFVESSGLVTGATTHGHIVMIRTTDENGEILPVFRKEIDIDILTKAKKELGEDVDPNLMSVIMDYEGNLWFTTGGFRIDPEYSADGFLGYVDKEYLDRAKAGEDIDADPYIHLYRLGEGESAENGISSHPEGCVILTNQACYLLNSGEDGVQVRWRTEYDSTGGTPPQEDSGITGAGLAWGGGSTPTLSEELVLFTDNQDPVNLLALDIQTGETVAQHPVFSEMEDVKTAVENSIIVYSADPDRVSALVCNWYGAGNAGLYEEDADSSVQSYDNLYDSTWIENGSEALQPGVERLDTVKKDGGYTMETVWTREDLCDTSMFKLSTEVGCLYGYTEIDGVWQYLALDWDTGETLFSMPVSSLSKYNNMAVGMMQGVNGNALYVPTDNMELLCMRDRFAYLPEKEFEDLDLRLMERETWDTEEISESGGESTVPATWLHSMTAENIYQPTLAAIRVNGLDAKAEDYVLYMRTSDGDLVRYTGEWQLTQDGGGEIAPGEALDPGTVYEIRVTVEDQSEFDQNDLEGTVKISAALGQ